MKTTVIFLGLGAVTIGALIFVAQNQSERAGSARRQATRANGGEVQLAQAPRPVEPAATFPDSQLSQPMIDVATPQPPAPRFEGDAWQAGVRAFEDGDLELAVVALEQAVEERPESAYRHYLLGLCYRRAGQPEAAVEEFSRSLSLAPQQPRAYAHLGRAWLDLGDGAAAREVIDAGLEQDLEHADLWQVLGRVELDEGRLEEAAAAFAKTTQLDPTHRWAWNNLGYVRLLQGRYVEAIEPLRRATQDERAEAAFFNNFGHALEQVGDLVAASEAFARAEELGHEPASASHERLLALLEAAGELQGPALLAESN